jgi:hypothetical protein
MDLSLLTKRLEEYADNIDSVSFCASPDVKFSDNLPDEWKKLEFDKVST